ncbi:GNAT family N-acetyltransferase [Gluconobacter kondonii]|uniref:GNAT family N-acetyltransferase n=1 Tax=Gluconobacter kondonii TaxID=941463 RepID=UPI001B8C7638|nr:GNAT family N-acetyltransferase [Gluconobacter kondonii]MBS1055116.1 GNAT family N-acetyltransferase [Gluconobacter kondonii]MBS1058389.1 GNAT family N-acetyltransferase [Gluconobacter kondonii]MBS1078933.1 GNAT family N-acetyltransferase [Gluconobacter kondonii]
MTTYAAGNIRTRWATSSDLPALKNLINRSIDALQVGFLTPEQIIASHAVMGLDTQLVEDGSYLIAEYDGVLAGCGGWSKRATLYGGDHSSDLRDPILLNPERDPARIRAMYTDPAFTRKGIGSLILKQCEQAAADHGFRTAELMATLSGEPLYIASGYYPLKRVEATGDGVNVPLIRMQKKLKL